MGSSAVKALKRETVRRHGRRRVLVISYLFPPGGEMGAQACAQIARYLPRYKWTPVVLTVRRRDAQHSAPQGKGAVRPVIRTAAIPHPFALYRGLKSWLGFPITETAGEISVDHNGASRVGFRYWLLSLLAAPDACTGWILPAVVAGLRAIRRHRIEHLFSSGPPWTSHLVALILARVTGRPWTAHFRDPWIGPRAEMARFKPVSIASLRIEAALERMVVRRADAVVCVTEEHTALLCQMHQDTSGKKFVTIPNGFDGAEWEAVEREDQDDGPCDEDSFVITYAGTLYDRRSPAPILRTLKSLIDAGAIAGDKIRVDLLGWWEVAEGRRLRDLAAECGLNGHVRLTGPLPRSRALRRMMRSHLLLLLAEGLTLQVPGKTYEYLRAGRPILALAPGGAVARLLQQTGGARVVDPADSVGMAAVLREAYTAWTGGHDLPAPDPAIVSDFDRRVLAGRFAELFAQGALCSRPHASINTSPREAGS